jgi:hypothetical protein
VAVYALGALATVVLHFFDTRWLVLWGRGQTQTRFLAKLTAEGILADGNAWMVGYSPAGELRLYQSNYNWDTGNASKRMPELPTT